MAIVRASRQEAKQEMRRLWNALHQLLISEHTDILMFEWPGEAITHTPEGITHELVVKYRWRDRREGGFG